MTEQWLRVAEFPPDLDLTPVRNRLDDRAIAHRITSDRNRQLLWVADAGRLEEAVRVLQDLFSVRGGEADSGGDLPYTGLGTGLKRQFLQTPVMVLCLLLSAVGAAVVQWQFHWVHWLTFQDFTLINSHEISFVPLQETLRQGEYWRLVTPIFLHFGLFHLAFNGLWLWEFGRRIEALAGSLHFLLVLLFSAVVSNWCQYLWGGPSLFGGMSGVLYALLGYIWIRNKVAPDPILAMPSGVVGFLLFWLVLCMTGVVSAVMQGNIANAAHFSGLVVGMALGGVFGLAGGRKAL